MGELQLLLSVLELSFQVALSLLFTALAVSEIGILLVELSFLVLSFR